MCRKISGSSSEKDLVDRRQHQRRRHQLPIVPQVSIKNGHESPPPQVMIPLSYDGVHVFATALWKARSGRFALLSDSRQDQLHCERRAHRSADV